MRRVLFITYYWPPAGGGGVQRAAKFCKYLPAYGWEPIVLTVADGNYEARDESLCADTESIEHVYRARSLEPHGVYRALVGVRGRKRPSGREPGQGVQNRRSRLNRIAELVRLNLFVPDPRVGWLPGATRQGRKAIREWSPEVIVSTAPPYTAHLVAMRLAAEFDIPWIADFRDPWLENHAYNSAPRLRAVRAANRWLEDLTLTRANRVVCVGPCMQELLAAKLSEAQRSKIVVITNGYDRPDITPANDEAAVRGERFQISHFGRLYERRFPVRLCEALRIALERKPALREALSVRVVGGADQYVRDALVDAVGANHVEVSPYLPHAAVLGMLNEPQLLLLPIDRVPLNNLIVTGKVFEYITTGNPILGIGPTGGDASGILERTETGTMFDYDDARGMADFILASFEQWRTSALAAGPSFFPEFERSTQAGQLADLLSSECGTTRDA